MANNNELLPIGTKIDFGKLRFEASRPELVGRIEKYVDNGAKVRVRHDDGIGGVTEMPSWYILQESIIR